MRIHEKEVRYVVHPTAPVPITIEPYRNDNGLCFSLKESMLTIDKTEAENFHHVQASIKNQQLDNQYTIFSELLIAENRRRNDKKEKIKELIQQLYEKAKETLTYEFLELPEPDLEHRVFSTFDAFHESLNGGFEHMLAEVAFPILIVYDDKEIVSPSGLRIKFFQTLDFCLPNGTKTEGNIHLFPQTDGRQVVINFFYQPKYFTPILGVPINKKHNPVRAFTTNALHPQPKGYHALSKVTFYELARKNASKNIK